ncbi:MAG TPA: shikimate dehydrogenase [Solirubrobacteraceae bacterium]|nr:shikimate dehydrogenase [Solirubrobacteraceae bacterium]
MTGAPTADAARTRLGVLGWPVRHSRSPAIQNAALAAAGLHAWRYQLLPVPPELLSEVVQALPGAGFAGANVTIPHKQAALALAGEATARARAIGAANTLTFSGDPSRPPVAADNTDAPALIAALPVPVAGRTALVLGAGGSARAAVWALLDAGAAEVRVWNRTAARARRLCADLGATPTDDPAPADLLVNCTTAGLDGSSSFDQLPLAPADLGGYAAVADFVYAEPPTTLIARARELGVPAVDGLELLIGQGALSFERFTGRPASLDAMRGALRATTGDS